MQSYYRLQRSDEDASRLLDPENQKSEPWGGTVWGRCDKCGGRGNCDRRATARDGEYHEESS